MHIPSWLKFKNYTAVKIKPFHSQPFMNHNFHFLATVESALPNVASVAPTDGLSPGTSTTSATSYQKQKHYLLWNLTQWTCTLQMSAEYKVDAVNTSWHKHRQSCAVVTQHTDSLIPQHHCVLATNPQSNVTILWSTVQHFHKTAFKPHQSADACPLRSPNSQRTLLTGTQSWR